MFYHKAKGHDTNSCFQLKKEIKSFIQGEHLNKYMKNLWQGTSSSKGNSNPKIYPQSPKKNA